MFIRALQVILVFGDGLVLTAVGERYAMELVSFDIICQCKRFNLLFFLFSPREKSPFPTFQETIMPFVIKDDMVEEADAEGFACWFELFCNFYVLHTRRCPPDG